MSMKEQRPLTGEETREYVNDGGTRCPFEDCKSDDIEGYGNFDIDSCNAWQNIKCHTCGRSWTDQYDLIGVDAHE